MTSNELYTNEEPLRATVPTVQVPEVVLPIKEIPPTVEEKAARQQWKSLAIEEIKSMGLLTQACTYITTLKLKNATDAEIVEQLNSLFSFTAKKIKQTEWKKILCAYYEIRTAYIRGSIDHTAALTAFMSDYLTDYFTSHSNDATNAVKLHKNLLDAQVEREKIQAGQNNSPDALKVSQTTRETLATIQQSLGDAEQPDFNEPAEEELEWDAIKDDDNV